MCSYIEKKKKTFNRATRVKQFLFEGSEYEIRVKNRIQIPKIQIFPIAIFHYVN